ncbi:MAG TPA: hypothetical protein VGA94_05665 [Thermodesulfobacteriota bacterium]
MKSMILSEEIRPRKIVDVVDRNKIEGFIGKMREQEDFEKIPQYLKEYIWGYFREFGDDKEKLKPLALITADDTYRYTAAATSIDNYTRKYFLMVFSYMWKMLRGRKVDTLYILDNELRDDRFQLAVEFFELSGITVVTPHAVQGKHLLQETGEERAQRILSMIENHALETYSTGDSLSYEEIERQMQVYLQEGRNIAYIEKDASVNYLEKIIELGKNSEHFCMMRNKAPESPDVIVYT